MSHYYVYESHEVYGGLGRQINALSWSCSDYPQADERMFVVASDTVSIMNDGKTVKSTTDGGKVSFSILMLHVALLKVLITFL